MPRHGRLSAACCLKCGSRSDAKTRRFGRAPRRAPVAHWSRKRRPLDGANCSRVELREGEALPAEVLERCADEIEFPVVDDEEAVVKLFGVAHCELRILRVEGRNVCIGNRMVWRLLLEVLRCEDRHLHAFALLREEVKGLRRSPVVDQDQGALRA